MENVIFRMFPIQSIKRFSSNEMVQISLQRCYSTHPLNMTKKIKKLHPYQNIHPWNSLEKFTKSLIAGIIHNNDGVVAINKPYGIPSKITNHERPSITGIVRDVNYSLEEALPGIAKELGYPSLRLVKTPEKFTSGVTILAVNDRAQKLVEKSLERAQGMRIVPSTYWAVTTRVTGETKGEKRVAMKMKQGPNGAQKLPIIIEQWGQNELKRREVKILNVQFKVLSNSTENLSSLLEIKSSTKKWHALRLFASTVLYSPILGDNLYGSRCQNIMGRWMNVSPFVDAAQFPPRLAKDLLEILKLTPGKQDIIPVHLHLREIFLPMYPNKNHDLVLTAPPMPEFMWTCRRLQFKHELFNQDEEDTSTDKDFLEPARREAVA